MKRVMISGPQMNAFAWAESKLALRNEGCDHANVSMPSRFGSVNRGFDVYVESCPPTFEFGCVDDVLWCSCTVEENNPSVLFPVGQ